MSKLCLPKPCAKVQRRLCVGFSTGAGPGIGDSTTRNAQRPLEADRVNSGIPVRTGLRAQKPLHESHLVTALKVSLCLLQGTFHLFSQLPKIHFYQLNYTTCSLTSVNLKEAGLLDKSLDYLKHFCSEIKIYAWILSHLLPNPPWCLDYLLSPRPRHAPEQRVQYFLSHIP